MKSVSSHLLFLLAVGVIAALTTTVPGHCQEVPPVAPDSPAPPPGETYRLRIENAQYGRVEISVDGGNRYLLIGRVTRAAIATSTDRTAQLSGVVVRSGGYGIAFTVAAGQVLKILPSPEPSAKEKPPDFAIVTDIKLRSGLFGGYCPPAGTVAQQQVAHGAWRGFPEGYVPSEDDTFGFSVNLSAIIGGGDKGAGPDPSAARLAEVRKDLVALSEQYTGQAMARAKESGRPVVTGIVTLRAKLPPDEPEPITAVTYSIDGDIVSAQNTLPSQFGWDTRRLPNGEHVVEVRALSKFNTVVTHVRSLVVVNN